MTRIWPFAFNFLYFASVACFSPFLVLYYQELGFTGAEIGVLTSIGPLVTLFGAPLWTGLADVTGRHRLVMSVNVLVAAVIIVSCPLLRTFWSVLLASLLFSAFFAPLSPFADSAAMVMLAGEEEMYGRVRLGGTVGYALAAPVAGLLVQNHGLKWSFWACGALLAVALMVSQKLEHGQVNAEKLPRIGVPEPLANRRWALFLVLGTGGGVALAGFSTYFPAYLDALGAQESLIGLALLIGALSEIPVLFFGNRLISRLKSHGLLMLTMVVTIIRLLLLAAISVPGLALLVQLLNGLSFAAMWMAGVSYAHENAPPGMAATAQGLFSATVFGLGNALGGFAGGLLLESVGGRGLYLVLGLVVLGIVVTVMLIERRLPDERVAPARVVHD
jgi:PPP family 3-phenylpropionic acid transporter